MPDGRLEACAIQSRTAASTNALKVMSFRTFEEDDLKDEALAGGQAVRLAHKEAEACIATDARSAIGGFPAYFEAPAEASANTTTSNTIWQVTHEIASPSTRPVATRGTPCTSDHPWRHVAGDERGCARWLLVYVGRAGTPPP